MQLQRGTRETIEFGRSVAGVMDTHWGDATAAAEADLEKLIEIAIQQGWWGLGSADAIDALLEAMDALGRRNCPLPIHDAFVASVLLDEEWKDRIESADIIPLVTFSSAGLDTSTAWPLLDGAGVATHLVTANPKSGAVEIHVIDEAQVQPGLAVPSWCRVKKGEAVANLLVDPARVTYAATIFGLAIAVRALAAAEAAHRLAVEHAKVRRQFGRLIGGFGAVQQRVAAAEITVTAAYSLVADAVDAFVAQREDAPMTAALVTRFIMDTATSVMFDSEHTLGAVGYFEEHQAAWLFRRVQSDSLMLRSLEAWGTSIADHLLEGGSSLPTFALGEQAELFRAEVRDLLQKHRDHDGHYLVNTLRQEAAERGLFAMRWPDEFAGRSASMEEMAVLTEEMKRAGGPVDRAMSASIMLGHSILRHGTLEQQAEFLPLIREGKLAFCLGYSEPEAGSDLASLRTRAVRDGDEWVIDGQKLWTTRADTATHVWLAVRTDPEASPRHAGITIFMVPMDTPGITISKHVALSGEISCTVYYDEVRVPDSARVGAVNEGWKVITDALSSERLIMGAVAGSLLRQFDGLVRILRQEIDGVDAIARDRLSGLAARLQAARSLVVAGVRAPDDAEARRLSPMAAVLSGELAEQFGQASLELIGDVIGLSAALGAESSEAPEGGMFEAALRLAPMYVIGGGTNDIQRGIIARGLGLARE